MKKILHLMIFGFAAVPTAHGQGAIDYEVRLPLPNSVVASIPPVSVSLAAATLPPANRTDPFSYDFSSFVTISGGTPPYTLSWSSTGVLPAELSLDPITGVLSGTPTTKETASFDVERNTKIRDSGLASGSPIIENFNKTLAS